MVTAMAGIDAVAGMIGGIPADIALTAAIGAMIAVVVPLGSGAGLSLWSHIIPDVDIDPPAGDATPPSRRSDPGSDRTSHTE